MEEIERLKKFGVFNQLTWFLQRAKKVIDKICCRISPKEVNKKILTCGLWLIRATQSQPGPNIPYHRRQNQNRFCDILTVWYKKTRLVNIVITVMNVYLGSLTLEIPRNSSGKHTYCNSVSFGIDCGKPNYALQYFKTKCSTTLENLTSQKR